MFFVYCVVLIRILYFKQEKRYTSTVNIFVSLKVILGEKYTQISFQISKSKKKKSFFMFAEMRKTETSEILVSEIIFTFFFVAG